MRHLPTKPAGFTLLELMITSLLGALLLMGGTAMFGLFMRNSSTSAIRTQINQEGQHILGVIEHRLRNAQSVTSCSSTSVTFIDQLGKTVVIARQTSPAPALIKLSYDGAAYTPLHSNFAVNSSSVFTCDTGSQTVTVTFVLASGTITQTFTNTVQVRSATIR